ncbi:MAG: glycosyltransferase [Pseudomonadales bacterium]|nr:glycosyltransferase [Pseudomonadales bacterium]RZV58842.1 MAG: glycosyltransferase [Pseudomonadales bacterium]
MTLSLYQHGDAQILLFARAPVVGKVKTRLIPTLGKQAACDLHEKLVHHVLALLATSAVSESRLYCDAPEHPGAQQWQRENRTRKLYRQRGSDLGKRMLAAAAESFDETDATYLLLIGSDCPFITGNYLASAIQALKDGADVVFGPAMDGGYVLLGINGLYDCLFENIAWGSGQVLQQSVRAAEREGLVCAQLEPLADIDRPEDVALLGGLDGFDLD